jgi:hypothetical protein
LCFSSDQFDLINATNGYTLGDDSLVFESEPGIELFRGKWLIEDSLVLIDYELEFSMFNPKGRNSVLIRDTLRTKEDRLELIFMGKHFIKTDLYDKESKEKIEAYRVSNTY